VRTAAVVIAVLLLALSGCSQEAGPTPEGGQAPDPGPHALHVKLEALTADDCYRFPARIKPPSCQKYVTEVANIPQTAQRFAAGHPRLADAVKALSAGITGYRSHSCDEQGTAACAGALGDIATALTQVRDRVAALSDAATRAS
jgi:hypothetical protein